ncbi:MAG: DUF2029 domain-containing protein [Gemmatimonadetes bacterium]|nr:DUF2029 domain-containing protein [Gemmatimonadota bacterium]
MTDKSGARRPAMLKLRRLVLAVTWSALFVLCFTNIETPGDFDRFVAFGRAASDGTVVYDPAVEAEYFSPDAGHWATWPPGFVPVASVFAWLYGIAEAPAVVLFQLLNLLMLAVSLLVAGEWLTGMVPRSPDPENRLTWDAPLVAVALLVPISLVSSNFELVQSNLLVLGLVLLGFRLLESKRWLGGFLFGVGSAIKATPILLLPYLVWRGRWRDLGPALAGVFVGWVMLPALVLGPSATGAWWRAWIDALPVTGSMDGWLNQSLHSMAVVHFGSEAGITVWIVATILLALLILIAFGRPFRRVDTHRTAAEVCVLLAATTIVSPVSWKAHYVTLVPLAAAVWVLAQGAEQGRRRTALIVLAIAATGINLPAPDLIGRSAAVFLQGYGIVLCMALLLVGVALLLLGSVPPTPAGVASTSERV